MLPNFRAYAANEGLKWLLAILWFTINGLLFFYTFMYYYTGPQFYYLHQMLGYGLCISRASAACINLNCSALLLPMCKRLITRCRGFNFCFGRQVRRMLDRSRSFHIYCGYLLCALAVVHCGAHAYNANYFSKYYSKRFMDLNVAKYANQNPVAMIFTTVAGITGLMLVVCLVLISVYASKPLRKNNHNRFWKSHHLFIVFYVVLFLHGFDGVIKYQTNVVEHQPGCYLEVGSKNETTDQHVVMPEPEPYPMPEAYLEATEHQDETRMPKKNANKQKSMTQSSKNVRRVVMPEPEPAVINVDLERHHAVGMPEPMPENAAMEKNMSSDGVHRIFVHGEWVEVKECDQPPPKFASCPRETWIWLCFPLFLYILERILRYFYASSTDATIVGYTLHPSDVIELRLSKKNFSAKAGQSIWIRCPIVSRVESHPFTLTTVPTKDDPTFSIHIKARGDWTREFRDVITHSDWNSYQRCKESSETSLQQENKSEDRDSRTDQVELQLETPASGSVIEDVETASLYDNYHCEEVKCHSAGSQTPNGISNDVTVQIDQIETKCCSKMDVPSFPTVFVEGPTGSAMEDVFKFKMAVCFAGGIGVTPFASVLNSLRADPTSISKMKLKRLHLVWACTDVASFEWFANLLQELQQKLWEQNVSDLLSVSLYSTNPNVDIEQEKKRFGLERCRLHAGRPNIAEILRETAHCHPRQTVGVFCCGPPGLTSSVRQQCFQTTSASKARFVFNKESF